jgi:hypothetical protein
MMGRESPEQWPSMSLLSQLLVISTSPPHTQVALARPVQAAHSKRLERMAREKGFHSRCPKRCHRTQTDGGARSVMPPIFSFKITKWACIRVELGRVDEGAGAATTHHRLSTAS